MICRFERMIFPQNPNTAENGYMVALYRPCGILKDSTGNEVEHFKAVGYCLPTSAKMNYDLDGHWSKSAKHGLQFEVSKYREIIIPTEEGIIAYLSSGQIKGVGPKTAQKIYGKFGEKTLRILDEEPDRLLEVPGISERKLKKICDSYLAGRGARDIITLLAPHGIAPGRAVRLYRQYGEESLDIVKNHPYQLCELSGIGFRTADRLAISMGTDPCSPERMDEALLFTLKDAESKGHLCLPKLRLLKNCADLLGTEKITGAMLADRAAELKKHNRITVYDGEVFRSQTAQTEESLARTIVSRLRDDAPYCGDLDLNIDHEERFLHFKLAFKQREAIRMGLTESLCVITGGPGTGKTSVQKVLLELYRKAYPYDKIVCCAPTGKAARRMEQSTGFPASTIHKALGLLANEDGFYSEPETLDADLVLVDEVSMMDIYLAEKLLRALPPECRLILVGDSDQLPSVGPGAVLREIIQSGCVPTVRLDQVYRQKEDSRIAANARLIRHGNLSLEYGPDFQFYDSSDLHVSAELIEKLYLQEVKTYGIDNVVLLSPYRQKTETGVNALNNRLQDKLCPASNDKKQAVYGKKCFRTGDKVMQTRNCDDISNGDVGYVTDIFGMDSDMVVRVNFGDGRCAEYDRGDLDKLDLAYACTVHKSQGAEFRSVIINLQCAHSVMLVRPLIYTAITRAKEKVIIVGDRKALCMAIRRTDSEQRETRLAHRIQKLLE